MRARSSTAQLPAATARTGARHAAREDLWLHALLLACGALPWLGYAAGGAWDQTELGLGMLLAFLGGTQLGRVFRARLSGPHAGTGAPARHGGRHGRGLSRTHHRLFHGQLGLGQAL